MAVLWTLTRHHKNPVKGIPGKNRLRARRAFEYTFLCFGSPYGAGKIIIIITCCCYFIDCLQDAVSPCMRFYVLAAGFSLAAWVDLDKQKSARRHHRTQSELILRVSQLRASKLRSSPAPKHSKSTCACMLLQLSHFMSLSLYLPVLECALQLFAVLLLCYIGQLRLCTCSIMFTRLPV